MPGGLVGPGPVAPRGLAAASARTREPQPALFRLAERGVAHGRGAWGARGARPPRGEPGRAGRPAPGEPRPARGPLAGPPAQPGQRAHWRLKNAPGWQGARGGARPRPSLPGRPAARHAHAKAHCPDGSSGRMVEVMAFGCLGRRPVPMIAPVALDAFVLEFDGLMWHLDARVLRHLDARVLVIAWHLDA